MIKEQNEPTHMISFLTNKNGQTVATLPLPFALLTLLSPSPWRATVLFSPPQQALTGNILLPFTARRLLHPPLPPRSQGLFILDPPPLALPFVTVKFAIVVIVVNIQIYARDIFLKLTPIGLRCQLPIFNPRDRVNRLLVLSLLRRVKRGVIAPFLAPTYFQNVLLPSVGVTSPSTPLALRVLARDVGTVVVQHT